MDNARTLDRIDLDEIYAKAEDARDRVAAAKAAEEARRYADQIRQARKLATMRVSERLELTVDPAAWEDTDLGEGSSGALTIDLGDRDGIELRLAYRHRGVTLGGDVLTVIGLAPIEGVWVASRHQIEWLSDLPAVVDDAIVSANRWDEVAEEEAGDPDLAEPFETPAIRIEGDTIEAVLARALLELVRPIIADTPTA
jgi:hypothetical protein